VPRRLWLALLAPPIAWFAALTANYFLVSWACAHAVGMAAIHLVSAAMLGAALVSGIVAKKPTWGRGSEAPPAPSLTAERTRFLATLALFGTALFSLVIIIQWGAVIFLDPCDPEPRSPFAPSSFVRPQVGVSDGVASPLRGRPSGMRNAL
jgi:hypothetical protein